MIFFDRFSSSTAFSSWQPERMWVLHAIPCLRLKVATLPNQYVRIDLLQCVQQLFGRLWQAYDVDVAGNHQYLRHPNTKKLLLVCDDDVDHDCTSRSCRGARSGLRLL